MEPYANFFLCEKKDVGTEVAFDAPIFVEDANEPSGHRKETHQVGAKIVSWRTSKADANVVMPVLAYVSPSTGTIHVLEPYAIATPMGTHVGLHRVTLSGNAIKKICSVAGIALAP